MESITRNQATVAKIQRLEDAPTNPFTGKAWPEGHDALVKSRRSLPVYGRFEEILDVYHNNQVFVLSSETGLGKSTQLPQLLTYDEYASGLRVVCTQPRRLAATELARRVAKEMGVTLGEEVGYQIGGTAVVDAKNKKSSLVYMTEGVLLGKQAGDGNLSDCACVILDEAHERTVETDILMAMLKKIVSRRKDFRVIIMSATVDSKLFQRYFNDCPLVHITGRNFKVQTMYVREEDTYSCYVTQTYHVVMHIHNRKGSGNILVFLPGVGDIFEVRALLRQHAKNLDVFGLHGKMTHEEQRRVLNHESENRKCILATNIAETSLTIDNVVYVIDTGLSKQKIHNPRLGMEMLLTRPISQASANQRAGRAGRTQDGYCYRLYSKESFDDMLPSNEPAIRTSNLHQAVLRLAVAGFKKIALFDWIDYPHPESLARACQDLLDWEMISTDGIPTLLGRIANLCPVDPQWYRAIKAASDLKCVIDMIDIVAVFSTQRSIFVHSVPAQEVVYIKRANMATGPSDHLTMVNVLYYYLRFRERAQKETKAKLDLDVWCKLNYLDKDALEEALTIRNRIGSVVKYKGKLPPSRASTKDTTKIRQALAIGLCTQIAIHKTGDDYRTVHENTAVRLEPRSVVSGSDAEWVVYNNISYRGGKTYINAVTAIDAEWLVDLPYFQDDSLPKKGNEAGYRQEIVKKWLDEARARIEASKTN